MLIRRKKHAFQEAKRVGYLSVIRFSYGGCVGINSELVNNIHGSSDIARGDSVERKFICPLHELQYL